MDLDQNLLPTSTAPRERSFLLAVLGHPILFLRWSWQVSVLRLTDEEIEGRACTQAIRILVGASVPAVVVETPKGAVMAWTPAEVYDSDLRVQSDLYPAEIFDLDRARLGRDGRGL